MMPALFAILIISVRTLNIKFKTEVDGEYTAHEQRSAMWSTGREKWEISVHRNPTNYADLVAFFKARRGRWQAFYFTWLIEHGGDGLQRLVRFDSDELDIGNDDNYFVFKIVEVITDE